MKKNLFLISLIVICTIMIVGCKNYSNKYNSNSDEAKEVESQTKSSEAAKKLDDNEFFKGNREAKVTLIELADFECPACQSIYPEIKKFVDEYQDKIRFVYLHYPLSYHQYAQEAALSFEAAAKQGKQWEMYDALFTINKLNSDTIKQEAQKLELDMNKFEEDKNSDELKAKIESHKQKGKSINLTGTPTFFLNDEILEINPTYKNLKKKVDEILAK